MCHTLVMEPKSEIRVRLPEVLDLAKSDPAVAAKAEQIRKAWRHAEKSFQCTCEVNGPFCLRHPSGYLP